MMGAKYTKLYEVLGFSAVDLRETQNIGQAAIKKAYRLLAKQWHPDKNGNSPESQEMMAKLSHAYKVLGDPDRRKAYDERGVGEESLDATNVELVGLSMLQELLDALMWEMPAANSLADLLGGKSKGKPKLRDWTHKDLLAEAKKALKDMRRQVEEQVTDYKAELNTLKAFAKKFKWDPEAAEGSSVGHEQAKRFDPLGGMLGSHLSRIQGGLDKGAEKLVEIQACEDMLLYYSFEFQAPQPAPEGRIYHSGGIAGKKASFVVFDDFADFGDPKGKKTAGFGDDVSNRPDLWPEYMRAEYEAHCLSQLHPGGKTKTPREFYMEQVYKMAEDQGFERSKP